MMTIYEALKGINAYPVPKNTMQAICLRRGLLLEDDADGGLMRQDAYQLATADLLLWLSDAPNVSQGGQDYSFTEEAREEMRRRAYALYSLHGRADDPRGDKPTFGYKGEWL